MKPKIIVARPIFEETLARLREHFEVNRHYIVVAALKALAEERGVHLHVNGAGTVRGDRLMLRRYAMPVITSADQH